MASDREHDEDAGCFYSLLDKKGRHNTHRLKAFMVLLAWVHLMAGWCLVIWDKTATELHLVNPISGARIQILSISTLPHLCDDVIVFKARQQSTHLNLELLWYARTTWKDSNL